VRAVLGEPRGDPLLAGAHEVTDAPVEHLQGICCSLPIALRFTGASVAIAFCHSTRLPDFGRRKPPSAPRILAGRLFSSISPIVRPRPSATKKPRVCGAFL